MAERNWSIGQLERLESPWGNAGGVIKKVEEVEKMAQTGVGWIEAGSYTLERRWGNDRNPEGGAIIFSEETNQPLRIYYHDQESGETTNSLGMPNKGVDAVEKEIPEMVEIAHSRGKPLVVNVAPVTTDPIGESRELVARAYEARADAVLLNAGCPNVITKDSGRHEILSLNRDTIGLVLRGLRDVVEKHRPIFLRTSPYQDFKQAHRLYETIADTKVVSAVFLPNTWPGHVPLDNNGDPLLEVPGNSGGKSGPAMADESSIQTIWAVETLHSSGIDVVSSSGIMAANELRRRLDLGAVAGAGTTFYYESKEGWRDDTDRMLHDLHKIIELGT